MIYEELRTTLTKSGIDLCTFIWVKINKFDG